MRPNGWYTTLIVLLLTIAEDMTLDKSGYHKGVISIYFDSESGE